jgi:hypothetical protein
MLHNDNWQAIALRRIFSDTLELTKSYNEFFNCTTDQDLKNFLNEITPDLVAVQMKLQDKLREKQIAAPAL